MSTGLMYGNVAGLNIVKATLNPEEISANTTEELTFTVAGLKTTDRVWVSKPSHTTGVGVVNARVSAADTLAITFMNTTGSGVDPAEEEYTIFVASADGRGALGTPER